MPVIRPGDAPVQVGDGKTATNRYKTEGLSSAGGLTQYGAYLETLYPGAQSSMCHWHTEEDEFIYMLSGALVVYEDGTATAVGPGDSVCFPAGEPKGHYLANESLSEAQYLIVGTRASQDTVTYPDNDRVQTVDREAGTRTWTTMDGVPSDNPYAKKVCPECGHVFKGNGWDGIDAHWRSKHEDIMPYEKAWPLLKSDKYPSA